MAISGLVITYNEEKMIGKCIDALFQVCDEVIIIDSCSTDKTAEIATSRQAVVISQPFLGDGPQRFHGLQFCKNDWILNLDADEFLDSDALEFFKNKTYLSDNYDAYNFRLKNYMGSKLIDFAGWYPDYTVRFFNKKTARPSTSVVHQKVISKNEKKLSVHIKHYSYDSFEQLITKKNQYSTWHSQQLFDQGKRINSFKPILNGLVSFVRCYVFKKGFLNGIDGLSFSLIQAFFSYMKYAKLIKLQNNENS